MNMCRHKNDVILKSCNSLFSRVMLDHEKTKKGKIENNSIAFDTKYKPCNLTFPIL